MEEKHLAIFEMASSLGCSTSRLMTEPHFGLYEAVLYQYPGDATENERRFNYQELESKEASAIRRSDYVIIASIEMLIAIQSYSDSEIRIEVPCHIEPSILAEGSRIYVNDNTYGIIDSISPKGQIRIYWHSNLRDGDKYRFFQTLEFIKSPK